MKTLPFTRSAFGRRYLVRAALAVAIAGGTGATALPVAAQSAPVATPPQAGYYRLKVGTVNVTALSDGTISLPLHELLTNTPPHGG